MTLSSHKVASQYLRGNSIYSGNLESRCPRAAVTNRPRTGAFPSFAGDPSARDRGLRLHAGGAAPPSGSLSFGPDQPPADDFEADVGGADLPCQLVGGAARHLQTAFRVHELEVADGVEARQVPRLVASA